MVKNDVQTLIVTSHIFHYFLTKSMLPLTKLRKEEKTRKLSTFAKK